MVTGDYYSTLGVGVDATTAEIKARFRFLSHAYHPDKLKTPQQREAAEEEFKRINEAYKVLSNPTLRACYDTDRHQQPVGTAPSYPGASSRKSFLRRLTAVMWKTTKYGVLFAIGLWIVLWLIARFTTEKMRCECKGEFTAVGGQSPKTVFIRVEKNSWSGYGYLWVEIPNEYINTYSLEEQGDNFFIYDGSAKDKRFVGMFSTLSNTLGLKTDAGFFDGSCRKAGE
jgi:hypothetical protein